LEKLAFMAVNNSVCVMLSALVVTMAACSKKDHTVPPGAPATDQQTIRLKDIVTESEASPQFAFTYDDSGYVATASFAGDFFKYHYFYKNHRIDSVSTNSTDGTYLLYWYAGSLVNKVEQYDNGGLALTVSITYDRLNRVTNMEWKPVTSGTAKTTTFDYYGNGNLHALKTFYPTTGITSLVTYQAYDDKKNVDGFAVFKDFFEHIVLLPAVKFQYNNATRVSMIRGINRIEIQNEYTYKDSLPTQQRATAQLTNGSGKGQTLTALTTYSYYNSFR
jgi:hypothetical protein